jgi:serine/threonine protein phosphatase 1
MSNQYNSRKGKSVADRLIAIGDIHGCRLALDRLLDSIQPESDDIIVTLGDYVDRGSDARGVVDRLIELQTQSRLVGILGNHEEMMLDVICGETQHHDWVRHGGVETLESYGFDGDLDFLPESHHEFFDSLVGYFEYGDFFFTHAAYDPDLPLSEQTSEMLRWYSLHNGIPAAHQSGKVAIVGHTAHRDGEILDVGHLICIDTYCYGGGWLTAVDLTNRTMWQANAKGQLRYQ